MEIGKFLLQHGARSDVKDGYGDTPQKYEGFTPSGIFEVEEIESWPHGNYDVGRLNRRATKLKKDESPRELLDELDTFPVDALKIGGISILDEILYTSYEKLNLQLVEALLKRRVPVTKIMVEKYHLQRMMRDAKK